TLSLRPVDVSGERYSEIPGPLYGFRQGSAGGSTEFQVDYRDRKQADIERLALQLAEGNSEAFRARRGVAEALNCMNRRAGAWTCREHPLMTRRQRPDQSGSEIGRKRPRGLFLGQVQGVEIGAATQHGFVRKLGYDLIGSAINHLKHELARGAVKKGLTRNEFAHILRVVANDGARVDGGNALAWRQLRRDCSAGCITRGGYNRWCDRRPHRSDAEICTHGSLLALLESNPTPPSSSIMNLTSQRKVRGRDECGADALATIC